MRALARSRRRLLPAALAVLIVAGALIVVRIGSDDEAAARTPAKTGTATVTRRDLIVSEDVDGTLGYADERDLGAHRAGVVTSLAEPGRTVKQGQALYAVDLEPTVLLTGSVPAYRPLSTDSSDGPDVGQLEMALAKLGYGDDLTVDKHFTSATADAVENWEDDLGRDDPDGTVELGDVVFAPGPVRISSQAVSVGTQVQAANSVLTVSSIDKVADLDLDVDKSDLVAPGDVVGVTLPDGKETKGKVSSIGSPEEAENAAAAADPNADPTVPVTVALTRPKDAARFDSGSIDVTIEQSRDEDVTVVPVTALVALAEGGYAIQVVDSQQSSGHRLLAVKTGTVTDDYAAITGDGVREGLTVVVPV